MPSISNFCENIGCECANPGPAGPQGEPGPQGPAGGPGGYFQLQLARNHDLTAAPGSYTWNWTWLGAPPRNRVPMSPHVHIASPGTIDSVELHRNGLDLHMRVHFTTESSGFVVYAECMFWKSPVPLYAYNLNPNHGSGGEYGTTYEYLTQAEIDARNEV